MKWESFIGKNGSKKKKKKKKKTFDRLNNDEKQFRRPAQSKQN